MNGGNWGSKKVIFGIKPYRHFYCVKEVTQQSTFLYQIQVKVLPNIPKYITQYLITWGGRRQWQPTPVLLPGKSHGGRSLVGYTPWGRKMSNSTEQLHFHFLPPSIGEGNGNLLQYSCLENSRDRAAQWAAVYGVAQSRTRLMQLSSSNSIE